MKDTNFFDVIERQYKSLEKPDYSFVSKTISSKPYSELVEQLTALFEIEEITDSNDDVSFRYLLSQSEKQWVVELSMVDLYAVIFRFSEIDLPDDFVTLDNATSEEKEIYSLLSNHGFKFLSKSELEKPIALNLCNTEPDNVCLYQALFSDTDILPWASQ